MTWIRQTDTTPPVHTCVPPMRKVWVTLPPPPPPPKAGPDWKPGDPTRLRLPDRPDGTWNDLWRCDDCGKLWRIGNGCDHCGGQPRGACVSGRYHPASYAWRSATLWQRIRNRRRRRYLQGQARRVDVLSDTVEEGR